MRKTKTEPVLNWHPNFRVVATLPDIKTVRTGFIVNFITITLALIALGWMLVTEVEIHNVGTDIDKYNLQIEGLKPANTKDLANSGKFVVASKPLQFADRFFTQKLSPLTVMASLVDARPDDILLDAVEISSVTLDLGSNKKAYTQSVVISGTLASDSLLSYSDFVEKVKNCPALKDRIMLTDKKIVDDKYFKPEYRQDAAAGAFKFSITITLKPSA